MKLANNHLTVCKNNVKKQFSWLVSSCELINYLLKLNPINNQFLTKF